MIFDKTLKLSDNQAITATAASTNVIDTLAQGKYLGGTAVLPRDQGKGNKVPLLIQVTEAFATLTSLTIAVQVDDNEAFSSPKTVATTAAIPVADLKVGLNINIDYIPKGTDERYLRLNYTVGGSNATTGKVTSGVVAAIQEN